MSRTLSEIMNPAPATLVAQRALTANGNEAAAIAAQQFHAATCPIRVKCSRIPAGQLAERTWEILSDGQAFVALMEAAEEMHLRRREGTCGDWSGEAGQHPAVWNIPLRDSLSHELTGHFEFVHRHPEAGPILLFAFDPQEVYDMNVVGAKMARLTERPVLVFSDGLTTDRVRVPIEVFANSCALRSVVESGPDTSGAAPGAGGAAFSPLATQAHPATWSGPRLLHLFDQLLAEFQALTGHRYRILECRGGRESATGWVVLNPPLQLVREAAGGEALASPGPAIVLPRLLRPFPTEEIRSLLGGCGSVSVIERGVPPRLVQYAASRLREAFGTSPSSPPVVVRSLSEVDASDAPEPGDASMAFLETLRVTPTLGL